MVDRGLNGADGGAIHHDLGVGTTVVSTRRRRSGSCEEIGSVERSRELACRRVVGVALVVFNSRENNGPSTVDRTMAGGDRSMEADVCPARLWSKM